MIGTNHFKKGLRLLFKDEPYVIIDFQHVKPGKGNQFTKTKIRNLITGSYMDLTVRSGEKFAVPDVIYKDMSFLYKTEDQFYFMDSDSYEQIAIGEKQLGSASNFLKEGAGIKVCLFQGQPVGVELPKTVQLAIVDTDPGFKGNTVSNATKSAKLETGYLIQVPLHLKKGDIIKINTSDGSYIERVKTGK